MKISQHPASIETDITCTCGATVHTRSTVPNVRVAVCSRPPFLLASKSVATGDWSRRSEKIRKPLPETR